MKYVIHACPERMWYVTEYLVPSLQAQGLTDIEVRNDKYHLGCLHHCMQIFASMEGDGGAWHMCDDVIICRNFRKLTEREPDGIVCGFVWERDLQKKTGMVSLSDMRWSFPCIYIPNYLARECAEWYFNYAMHDTQYATYVSQRKFDDLMFLEFLKTHYPNRKVRNHEKSVVDHIDWLIGGSLVNQDRTWKIVRAQWFDDKDLVDELAEKLKARSATVTP